MAGRRGGRGAIVPHRAPVEPCTGHVSVPTPSRTVPASSVQATTRTRPRVAPDSRVQVSIILHVYIRSTVTFTRVDV